MSDQNELIRTPSAIASEFDLPKLGFVLRRSLGWIALLFLISAFGVFLYLRYTKPIFQANSTIKLEIENSSELFGIQSSSELQQKISVVNLEGELQLIKSPLIYEGVIDSAHLRISYYYMGDFLTDERYGNAPFKVVYEFNNNRTYFDKPIYVGINPNGGLVVSYKEKNLSDGVPFKFGQKIELNDMSFSIIKTKELEEADFGNYYFVINSTDKLLAELAANTEAEPENITANIIRVGYKDKNQGKAIAIVSAINKNYLLRTIENKNRQYEQSLRYITKQIDLTRDTLEYFEQQMWQMAKSKQSMLPSLQQTEEYSYQKQLQREYEQKQQAFDYQLREYQKFRQYIQQDSGAVFLSVVAATLDNQQLDNLLNQLVTVETEFKRISAYNTAKTATYRQYANLYAETKRQLLQSADIAYKRILALSNDLRKSNGNQLMSLLTQTDTADSELNKMRRLYAAYAQTYDIMLKKFVEIDIAKAGTVPNFQILSQPSAGRTPIFPVVSIVYVTGFIAAFLLALLLISVRYVTLNKINNVKQVERLVTVPVIGMIPTYSKDKLDFARLIAHIYPKSTISEALRSIRTNIDFLQANLPNRIITVTSTLSGEGKTFVSINLAGVIAMSEKKTIILDLDMRKPKIHLAFNIDHNKGVSSVLIGKYNLDDCIFPTDIPNLFFIPSGAIPPNPSELVLSPAFDDLLNELKKRFHTILIDTPPVGLVTDGIIIMQKATHAIFVTRAEKTKLSYLEGINKLAETSKFRNLAVVVNGIDSRNSYGYGYGYGYGYSYGYGYGYSYGTGSGYGYYDDTREILPTSWVKRMLKMLRTFFS